MNAGKVLGALRAKTGLTVRQTAKRAHVGARYLRAVERGERVAPPALLGHIANVLAAALIEGAAA